MTENLAVAIARDVMANAADKKLLSDQREALKSYLEALLEEEVEAYSETQQQPVESDLHRSVAIESQPIEPEKVSIATQYQKNEHQVDVAIKATTDTEPPLHRDTPVWADFPFQVLTFEISGNLYAAPLKLLNGIVPMPEKITHVPSKIPWFLGLFRNRGTNVKVIDIEKLWLTQDSFASDKLEISHHLVLLIDEGRFGFRVNKVKSILNLYEDDIQWRQHAGCDGVLCGSIRSNMATLLDIIALNKGLADGIWAGPR